MTDLPAEDTGEMRELEREVLESNHQLGELDKPSDPLAIPPSREELEEELQLLSGAEEGALDEVENARHQLLLDIRCLLENGAHPDELRGLSPEQIGFAWWVWQKYVEEAPKLAADDTDHYYDILRNIDPWNRRLIHRLTETQGAYKIALRKHTPRIQNPALRTLCERFLQKGAELEEEFDRLNDSV